MNNLKRYTIIPIAFALLSANASAAPRTKVQMQEIAAKLFGSGKLKAGAKSKSQADINKLKELKTSDGYVIYGFDGNGFAVIATDDASPAILGYSDSKYGTTISNPNFEWWLSMVNEAVVARAKAGKAPIKSKMPSTYGYAESVPALCETRWGQDAPYNNLCPTATDGTRTLTGCAATSTAQVLFYHRAPEHGIGSHTIYYPANNMAGMKISVDFEKDNYDWNAMLETYDAGYSTEEGDAVALIMRDLGVAFDMEYGSDAEGGSGALHENVAIGLQRYYGIDDAKYIVRKDYSDDEWMRIIYEQINDKQPLVYGGFDKSMGGHSFVFDGYDAEGKVHVNWGWDGSYDGYYDMFILDPSAYKFSNNQEAVINIVPDKSSSTLSADIALNEAGTLALKLDADKLFGYDCLKVSGNINATDLRTIRSMAGRDAEGNRTRGHLRELDLTDANIVVGTDYYMMENGKKLIVEKDASVPDKVFAQTRLQKIILPKAGIKNFGKGVWAYANKLKEVQMTATADADFCFVDGIVYNSDKTILLEALPLQTEGVDVPKGVTTIADYAFAGCNLMPRVSLSNDVKTIGKEAFANCWSMKEFKVFAKDVPQLNGANVFNGANIESCLLTVRAGQKTRFQNTAQWKDFANIVEFGTTIKARNVAREYGDENPRLTFTVSGDKVEGKPVLKCEATPESPCGRYTIHIEPGTVNDEAVEFEDGYLVVTQAPLDVTVEDATRETGMDNPMFNIVYRGFKNGETEEVIDVKPVATCMADASSPAGLYDITVGGGEAKNYELFYNNGVLTVTQATAIDSILNHPVAMDIYTPQGVCVKHKATSFDGLAHGIYIVNGKKIVK